MAAERIPMRKLREVVRLRLACGRSGRVIAQSCRLSVSTVSGYLGRITVAKLVQPQEHTALLDALHPGRET